MQSLDFPTRGSARWDNGIRMCWANPIAIVIVPVTLKVKYALGGGGRGGIVFGSQISVATICAPPFNSGYWPGSHCSPAFPNGGIPLSGNIVYKRRQQARPPYPQAPLLTLQPTAPLGISFFFIYDPLLLSPLAESRLPPSQLGLGVPWIIPAGGGTEGSSLWPFHTRKAVSFCSKSASEAETGAGRRFCMSRRTSSEWPPLLRRALFDHWEELAWCFPRTSPPPHTQPDNTEDKSDSVCYARFLALSYRRNVCSQTNNAYPCLSDQLPPPPAPKKPSWHSRARTEVPCKDQTLLRSIQVSEIQGGVGGEMVVPPPPPKLRFSEHDPLVGPTVLHWKHLGSGRKVRTYTCMLGNNTPQRPTQPNPNGFNLPSSNLSSIFFF